MGCTKFRNKDGTVVGFTCSHIQERGKFLWWHWELHRYTGLYWYVRYPHFPFKRYKKYFKERLQFFSFWEVFKEEVLLGFFWWFEMTEKEIMPGTYNPLWHWFFFQRWYRKKLKK